MEDPKKHISLRASDRNNLQNFQGIEQFRKKYVLEFQEDQIQSLPSIFSAIKKQSEELDSLAIEMLNPFESEEELLIFSRKIHEGEGMRMMFYDDAAGIGEEIQEEFSRKFFKKFFPKLRFGRSNKLFQGANTVIDKSNAITLEMFDFHEVEYPFGETYEELDVERPERGIYAIELSMVQMKILHSVNVPVQLREKLWKAIYQRLVTHFSRIPCLQDFTWIVGAEHPDKLLSLNQSIVYVLPYQDHLAIYINLPNHTSWRSYSIGYPVGLRNSTKVLRFLYAIGDYAYVQNKKNKMEAVTNGVPVITPTDAFMELNENSNQILDTSLVNRGWIRSLSQISEHGGLGNFAKPPPLDIQDRKEMYLEYLKSPNRLAEDIPLKESMKLIFKRMEMIHERKFQEK